ncbi:hypothetical protein [Catenuloplanes atrovinosus]|uniref:Tetratricopeptide repeat protein n=1 Tax=Catenuloplanes atrovinosus TaxID=137266 RepID=A0AAE3YRV9_9ACTN|nr:hypothetical protein [Catenuloplanes atrovinosus]MDR7277516.1 hypothetical protein [Catenuloplanes atrovinosus]
MGLGENEGEARLREEVAAMEAAAAEGRYEDALAASESASGTIRRLREIAPENASHVMAAAGLLHNRSHFLQRVGRNDAAVTAAAESAALFRELVPADPAFYRPYLADALVRLGAAIEATGRKDEAREPIAEAVRQYRETVFDAPRHRAGLARTLVRFGEMLAEAGELERATEAMAEAADLFRAADEGGEVLFSPSNAGPIPAGWELLVDGPAYATALRNLAAANSLAGRSGAAVEDSRQAVDIARRVARARGVSEPDLADLLVDHAQILAEAGYLIEARKNVEEAIAWYESAGPTAYEPRLSWAYDVRERIAGQ